MTPLENFTYNIAAKISVEFFDIDNLIIGEDAGDYSFSRGTLKTVTIYSTSISVSAFYCSSITTLNISKNLTAIYEEAFGDCGIGTVYYAGTEDEWSQISIDENYNEPILGETMNYNASF